MHYMSITIIKKLLIFHKEQKNIHVLSAIFRHLLSYIFSFISYPLLYKTTHKKKVGEKSGKTNTIIKPSEWYNEN